MFEFDLYEKALHSAPSVSPTGTPLEPLDIERVSLLRWSEHCIECAAPDCFASCDLYQPRLDRRCRRFEYGIYRNPRIEGSRGPGAEVRFKRWGKIETRGNARLANVRMVQMTEWILLKAAPVMHVVGRLTGKATREIRYHYMSFALVERLLSLLNASHRSELPDGFLVEIYNPAPRVVAAQLTFAVDRRIIKPNMRSSDLPLTYTKRLEIIPGYFRALIPVGEFRHIISSGLQFAIAFTPEATSGVHLVFLTLDLVSLRDRHQARTLQVGSSSGRPERRTPSAKPGAKCIVFDLDNTLWQGTLLEDDDVRLRAGLENLLQQLDARGILLSVASKNAHDHAWSKICGLGLADYFLYPKINWLPKSENIQRIAADLNIGLDTFVFVDDSPFERAEVASVLPMVECVDITELETFTSSARCAGSTSEEARNRRRSYQQEATRSHELTRFGDDYIGFLRSCSITVTIRAFAEYDFGRVAELVQRTNQLNFSGHTYSRDEIRTILDDPSRAKFVLSCTDRFGSYGNVGFCIVRFSPERVIVDDFMLSCRVQNKLVEQALFSHLIAIHPAGRARYMVVHFRETERNQPARQVLESLQFSIEATQCALDVSVNPLTCDFIEVRSVHEAGELKSIAT